MTNNDHSEVFELPAEPVVLPAVADKSSINVNDDGRVNINWDSTFVRRFSKLYTGPFLPRAAVPPPEYSELPTQITSDTLEGLEPPPDYSETTIEPGKTWKVKLNIVIQVVGSRGDVQPFIAVANELQPYGHRVRLATHDVFENFVKRAGLEFYPIGGDPSELMAYMVKNPGLVPAMESLRAGEIRRKRIMIREMLNRCWLSCIEPDPVTGMPFVADAIIANPPSFAHVHCAQALNVPVHLMFTMPWSSTKAFPHPLANLNSNDTDQGLKNFASYGLVNWLTWQGVGDVINKWRRELDLDEVAMFEGPHLPEILRIPYTYCWSTALVPRPSDWPAHIDVCGFIFRDPPQYEPPVDLQDFLASGPPPIYIGFGSIVVDNPKRITAIVVRAVNAVGVRAIISRGWSNLSGAQHENIYYIGDCPHEWLFEHVAAVVHHGGAGTTACGLRKSRPTLIVPFFGDQPFWGDMVAATGAGPVPVPYKELTVEKLADGIRYCLSERAANAASAIAAKINAEIGVRGAVSSFHRSLPVERLECDLCPGQPAVWSFSKKGTTIKLSKIAAQVLIADGLIDKNSLTMHAIAPILIETRRWDPITGGASAVMGTATDLAASVLGTFYKPAQELRDHYESRKGCPSDSISNQTAKQSTGNPSVKDPPANQLPQRIGTHGSDISTETATLKARPDHGRGGLVGRMAGASAKSLGSFVPTALKGMTVDIPLALTEGLRNVPRYYGEEPRDHGPVTDIKSGFTVAGKGFALGMAEAISDVAVQPYRGLQEAGPRGAITGLGKGMANMASKAGCAMFGVFAYPSAGIARSLRTLIHSRTRKQIAEARHSEAMWLLGSNRHPGTDKVVAAFGELFKRKNF
ncbi:UDP-Glycosyltransferase/glycogen phosphorylase [Aspergillus egyptiacus]|nr:UDP-Glycosyltransferase/glycogen phosphorylase [Aspergillus egyptiacus]